ncbi:MAG: hypothetical protein JWO06_632 [Bacteroidota bacterium]|nr:hypothetical protein [Bacteroidota bacterium]
MTPKLVAEVQKEALEKLKAVIAEMKVKITAGKTKGDW